MRPHVLDLVSTYSGWFAYCSCGWAGPQRVGFRPLDRAAAREAALGDGGQHRVEVMPRAETHRQEGRA